MKPLIQLLAESFPSLKDAPPIDPFDRFSFMYWALNAEGEAKADADLVLALYVPSFEVLRCEALSDLRVSTLERWTRNDERMLAFTKLLDTFLDMVEEHAFTLSDGSPDVQAFKQVLGRALSHGLRHLVISDLDMLLAKTEADGQTKH